MNGNSCATREVIIVTAGVASPSIPGQYGSSISAPAAIRRLFMIKLNMPI